MTLVLRFESPCFRHVGTDQEPVEERPASGEREEVVHRVDFSTTHCITAAVDLLSLSVRPGQIPTDRLALGNDRPVCILETGNLSEGVSCFVFVGLRSSHKCGHALIAKRDVGFLEYVGHESHVGGQPKPVQDSLVLGLLIQFDDHTLFSTAAGKPTEPVVDQLTLADVLSRR